MRGAEQWWQICSDRCSGRSDNGGIPIDRMKEQICLTDAIWIQYVQSSKRVRCITNGVGNPRAPREIRVFLEFEGLTKISRITLQETATLPLLQPSACKAVLCTSHVTACPCSGQHAGDLCHPLLLFAHVLARAAQPAHQHHHHLLVQLPLALDHQAYHPASRCAQQAGSLFSHQLPTTARRLNEWKASAMALWRAWLL